MKYRLSRKLKIAAAWLLAAASLMVSAPSQAQSFTIDTSAASPITGLWWNANESGWGATITQQSYMMFVTMFVYDNTGNAVWYTMSCTISSAACNGDLLRVRGGTAPALAWSGNNINVTKAGTMALNFSSNDAASMVYVLDGLTVNKQITRQIFGPPPPATPTLSGSWQGAIVETRTNCTQSQNNGARATYGQYEIGMGVGGAGALTITLFGVTGLQCTYSGNFSTNGARLIANGTESCNDGRHGTWQSTNMLVTQRAMSLEFAVQLDTTETCTIAAVLGGSRP